MKAKHKTPPVDVSKSLFMDLAFLLIAALVLMVNEPAKAEANKEASKVKAEKEAILEKVKKLELRPSAVKEVVESATEGESIFIKQNPDGKIFEITATGKDLALEGASLATRFKEMKRPRYAVLHVDPTVPYDEFSNLRDKLQNMKSEGILDFCIEAAMRN